MKNVINYLDVGFGDTNIDFLSSPFDQIDNTSIVLNGFGDPEYALLENNSYFNNRNLNFGSKVTNLSKNLARYDYEEIYERGAVLINKNSSKNITIKNKNIQNPIFLCTPSKSTKVADITLVTETFNSNTFKVTNTSDIEVKAQYIATGENVKKTKIPHNQTEVDILNKKIIISLEEIEVIEPKYTTLQTEEMNLINSSNIVLGSYHNLTVNQGDPAGAFVIPQLQSENNFFILSSPPLPSATFDFSQIKLASSIQIKQIEDPDDESSSLTDLNYNFGTSGTLQYFDYGFELTPDTIYYFWYSYSLSSWILSNERFPNITTYL